MVEARESPIEAGHQRFHEDQQKENVFIKNNIS